MRRVTRRRRSINIAEIAKINEATKATRYADASKQIKWKTKSYKKYKIYYIKKNQKIYWKCKGNFIKIILINFLNMY